MPGIPREVTEHCLNIKSEAKTVRQCLRGRSEMKLPGFLAVAFIKEVKHPESLAILVKKKNEKYRMCVDYISLNKACPKDPFPLPRID